MNVRLSWADRSVGTRFAHDVLYVGYNFLVSVPGKEGLGINR